MEVSENEDSRPGYSRYRFEFADTGIGIKPEFMDNLFDPFSREQDSRVDKTEGSGLGMAITKKIVDMLGGTITVHSEVGKGSMFDVVIPIETYDQERSVPEDVSKLKILVVDDDEIMCEYTMQMLDEMGIRGEWSNNGNDAVRMIQESREREEQYDAVILDWQMPEKDGMQTARMIRSQVGHELPILIISAYDWDDIREEAKTVEITGFLAKPVFPSTLLRGLQRYVLHQETDIYSQEPVFDFTGKHFLLTEDNEMNREIAVALLSDAGAIVECANNGAESVECFKNAPEGYYDLILMDIQMPVMDGYTAVRAIRALSRKDAASVPILAMTADVFQEDVIAAKEAGMNGHLAKPIDVLAIKREITRFL